MSRAGAPRRCVTPSSSPRLTSGSCYTARGRRCVRPSTTTRREASAYGHERPRADLQGTGGSSHGLPRGRHASGAAAPLRGARCLLRLVPDVRRADARDRPPDRGAPRGGLEPGGPGHAPPGLSRLEERLMEALKFLRRGRVAPFTGVAWPPPGEWLVSDAPSELCRHGVHGLLPDVLATWIAEELWRVELDGGEELAPGIVVAPRGRLVAPVEAWDDETAREFAQACVAHVRGAVGRAAEYAADATELADRVGADDSATRIGYMAAHAAEAMAPGGFAAERRWQSHWLAARLGVTGQPARRPARAGPPHGTR